MKALPLFEAGEQWETVAMLCLRLAASLHARDELALRDSVLYRAADAAERPAVGNDIRAAVDNALMQMTGSRRFRGSN